MLVLPSLSILSRSFLLQHNSRFLPFFDSILKEITHFLLIFSLMAIITKKNSQNRHLLYVRDNRHGPTHIIFFRWLIIFMRQQKNKTQKTHHIFNKYSFLNKFLMLIKYDNYHNNIQTYL